MASPYWDDVFYWLSGRFYQWVGGFGAQLVSREWWTPKPGTRRKLFDKEFVVFCATRKWLRVEVSWALVKELKDYSDIAALKTELQNWGHGYGPR